MDKIRILQLGNTDWNEVYQLPGYVELTCSRCFTENVKIPYDLVFKDRRIDHAELPFLQKAVKAYCYYEVEDIASQSRPTMTEKTLCDCKMGKVMKREDVQAFLSHEARNFYAKPYGEKFKHKDLSVAQDFKGKVSWNGNYSVELEGDFGDSFRQIVFWRNNIPIFSGQAIDLWLEYEKDPAVEISMTVTQFVDGSVSDIQNVWHFSGEELRDVVTIDNEKKNGGAFFSISARGNGRLKIISLHDRYSRRGHGTFLPGGQRCVTGSREEIFAYFDPGDRKPPLNVYFSGYKTMEGFEGYNLMRGMGSPFLLIAEARLEGGAFYIGSDEYEQKLADIIQGTLEELAFGPDELILSGLSMGTCGALYYGSVFKPHAIILGKPVPNFGDVGKNERLLRPGGFPSGLDILRWNTGGLDAVSVMTLNNRFWNRFDEADWSATKFIVAYMIEDDYDPQGYQMLLSHLSAAGVEVYGKGLHGRHNDDTAGIVSWFVSQYKRVLLEDFSRGSYE